MIGLLGVVLGILVGAGLVLANPLGWFGGLPPLSAEFAPAKAYRWDDYRGIEVGLDDLLGVARRDRKVALMDPTLTHVRIGIIVLPAGEGTPAALAVKVSTIAEENSLWSAQLGMHDHWNIFWPGEGSVFATGYSNFWSVFRDTFFANARGGDRESMATSYPVSKPSPLGMSEGVSGAAGRYAGFTGDIREVLYPTDNGPDWTLAIKVNPPPVTPR